MITIGGTLAACDDDHHSGHHSHHQSSRANPELYQFDIIDTYGTNSEFDDTTELALSPLVNAGQFEVFWQTQSDRDYYVELRFNDKPSTDGSRLITSDFCGPFYYCHDNQYQYCDY